MNEQAKNYVKCLSRLKKGDRVTIGLTEDFCPTVYGNLINSAMVEVLYNVFPLVVGIGINHKLKLFSNEMQNVLLGSSRGISSFWNPSIDQRVTYNIPYTIKYCYWANVFDIKIISKVN